MFREAVFRTSPLASLQPGWSGEVLRGGICQWRCWLLLVPSGNLTMENHHFSMGKFTISMVIFNSYFDITRGYVQCVFSNAEHVFFPLFESLSLRQFNWARFSYLGSVVKREFYWVRDSELTHRTGKPLIQLSWKTVVRWKLWMTIVAKIKKSQGPRNWCWPGLLRHLFLTIEPLNLTITIGIYHL